MGERDSEFYLGTEFEEPWGRDQGFMHKVCTLPEPNKLECVMEERAQGWDVRTTMVFSREGMINERVFVTKGLSTKKFYQKLGVEGVERVQPA